MLPEEMPTGTLYMINADTGEEIELDGIQEITMEPVEPIDIEPIKTGGEIEISMDVEISDELKEMLMLKKLVCKGSPEEIAKQIFRELPHEAKIQEVELRQSKTHKKKRINKKWAKRYGYICTVYYL